MCKAKFLFAVLLSACLSVDVTGQTVPVTLFTGTQTKATLLAGRILEDTSQKLSTADLDAHPEWFHSPDSLHRQSTTGVYWLTTSLVHTGAGKEDVLLYFNNLSFVDVYYRIGDTGYLHRAAGTFRPARELLPGDARESVALTLPGKGTLHLLIRIQHTKHYWPLLHFYVQDAIAFRQTLYRRQLVDWLLLGAIGMFFIYCGLSLVISRHRPYLWLLLFIGFAGLYATGMSGYWLDWVFPQNPAFGWIWVIHLIHAGTICALFLLIDAWEIPRRWPRIYHLFRRVIACLILMSLACFCIDYFTSDYRLMNYINMAFLTGFFFSACYTIFTVWAQLDRPQRLLAYGYMAYLSGYPICIVLFLLLREEAILPTAYFGDMAALSMILLFSTALQDELRQHEIEKNTALQQLSNMQQRQNLVLENLVQARTVELLQQQTQLEDRNRKIEMLMQELQHRVKNNLQLLYGLIKLQLPGVGDPPARLLLQDNLNRIRAMSIVNEKLYQYDEISVIRLNEFIRETVTHVSTMYDYNKQVGLNIEIPDEIIVRANFAIPFGLILTELLTNAFKYALPESNPCLIGIAIQQKGSQLEFIFRDNGSVPVTPLPRTKGFSGLSLVRDLVRQLHGTMETWYDMGLYYKFSMPHQ